MKTYPLIILQILFWLFVFKLNIYTQTINLSEGANFKFKNIWLENGLSQSTAYAITQDALGFMWFGTADSLNRYDGYTIKVLTENEIEIYGVATTSFRLSLLIKEIDLNRTVEVLHNYWIE